MKVKKFILYMALFWSLSFTNIAPSVAWANCSDLEKIAEHSKKITYLIEWSQKSVLNSEFVNEAGIPGTLNYHSNKELFEELEFDLDFVGLDPRKLEIRLERELTKDTLREKKYLDPNLVEYVSFKDGRDFIAVKINMKSDEDAIYWYIEKYSIVKKIGGNYLFCS